MSMNYQVWVAMLKHCQRYTPKLADIAGLKTVLLTIWNDFLQEFIDIMATISFCNRLHRVLLGLVDILFQYWMSCKQPTIITETSKQLMNSCAKFNLFLYEYTQCITRMITWKIVLQILNCWIWIWWTISVICSNCSRVLDHVCGHNEFSDGLFSPLGKSCRKGYMFYRPQFLSFFLHFFFLSF